MVSVDKNIFKNRPWLFKSLGRTEPKSRVQETNKKQQQQQKTKTETPLSKRPIQSGTVPL